MLPKDSDNEVPFATAHIRAVKLIQMGFLTMKEVFSQNASYGVYTGKNIGDDPKLFKVRGKIKLINRLYLEVVLKPGANPQELRQRIEFFKQHKKGELVTTRKRLREELQEAYGAASDTDGEGYDSDTANKLYPGAFQFN